MSWEDELKENMEEIEEKTEEAIYNASSTHDNDLWVKDWVYYAYSLTVGAVLRQRAKRNYIQINAGYVDTAQREKRNMIKTEKKDLGVLKMWFMFLNQFFIIDLLILFLLSSKFGTALTIVAVYWIINHAIYRTKDFTNKSYRNITVERLKREGRGYKFRELEIYSATPFKLLEHSHTIRRFLWDSSSKSKGANIENYSYDAGFTVLDRTLIRIEPDYIQEEVTNFIGHNAIIKVETDNPFKNNKTRSINDEWVRITKVIPQKQAFDEAVYSERGVFYFDASVVTSTYQETSNAYYDMLQNVYQNNFKEFKGLQKQKEEEMRREQERLAKEQEKEKLQATIDGLRAKGMEDKAIKILVTLTKNQEDIGISVHDAWGNSHTYTSDYIKIRAKLTGNTTLADVNRKKGLIAQKTGSTPKISTGATESSIYLLFRLKDRIKSRKLSYEEIEADAENGVVNIGTGVLGEVKVKYPRADEPFFSLIGGISRSGKSTFATRFITGALLLKDNNDFYDYQDVFIMSMKATDDYIPLKWDKKGMYITDEPLKMYEMLKTIDKIAQQRVETFREAGVVNIKDYNNEFPNDKMGKILLVVDEYKNTLTTAESMKIETEAGKKKLSDAIEEMLVKINSLHGSRGVNTIVITQSFAKNSVGRVRDTLGSQFLGFADKDVWNSIDQSQEMSNYMKSKEEKRQGLFFMKAPDFQLDRGVEVDKFESGFIEISTHFTPTNVIAKSFNRKFNTLDKYGNVINNEAEVETTAVSDEDDLF